METLTVYPENNEQLTALKAVMGAMKVAFVENEEEEIIYPDYVIEGVKKAIKQADNGQLKPYTGIANMLKGK